MTVATAVVRPPRPRALRALALAATGALLAAIAPSQTRDAAPPPAPRRAEAPPTMLATSRYLFVLRGDELLQLDVDTLQVLRRVRLPEAAPPAVRAPRAPRNEIATALRAALDWLKAHQDPDGRFDADGFFAHCPKDDRCKGPGLATKDIGVTGLAILAFLANGSTLRQGPYRDAIRRGIAWLREQQDPETGRFGTGADQTFVYDHAIATLATSEAYGLSEYRVIRKNARRGVDYLLRHRNPHAAWRYQPRDGDNDTSVTAWCVMALASAKQFGLEVDDAAFQGAKAWLDRVTDPETGRTGYTTRGGLSSRNAGDHAQRYPPEGNEAMTGAGLFCRFLLGETPSTSPILTKQADLLLAKPPAWEPSRIDEYGWLFETLALYQVGGRHWKDWSARIATVLLDHQRRKGHAKGSWDPIGVWGGDGGRVFSTALHCLTLQTLHRVARVRKR